MGDEISDIGDTFKKWKRRFKRAICCGVLSILIAIGLLVGGIALLVEYSKYWDDNDEWERHLAYTGLAFILIAVLLFIIAIIVFIVICKFYNRMSHTGTPMKTKHKEYAPGTAPYPQQQPYPQQPQANMPLHPSAPIPGPKGQGYHSTDQADVKIEVIDHHKY